MTGAIADFDFATAGRIRFGSGRVRDVAAAANDLIAGAPITRRALLVTGSRPERAAGVAQALTADGWAVRTLPSRGEPTVGAVRAAVAAAEPHAPQVVVAVGGGSVIDLAKAVAVLLGQGLLGGSTDPLEYLEVVGRGRPLRPLAMPVIAVPTTAGTGAEVTANAVLTSPEHGVKASLRQSAMLPAVAIVDPDLTLDCPPAVTASSGLDALTQCLEPLVSRMANPLTDAIATAGLAACGRSLVAAYRDGADLAARTDMAFASLCGGLALANAKLGAVHGLAGVIGGRTGAPHGETCAAVLVATVEVTLAVAQEVDDQRTLARYATAARALAGDAAATAPGDLVPSAAGLVADLRAITAALGVRDLTALGLREVDLPAVATAAAAASSTKGHPLALSAAQFGEILRASMGPTAG